MDLFNSVPCEKQRIFNLLDTLPRGNIGDGVDFTLGFVENFFEGKVFLVAELADML